jgi:4-amino-4-deoxy-L-arabinose transferase-like glycosyltransferase
LTELDTAPAPAPAPAEEADSRRTPLTTAERRWLVALVGVGAVLRIAWFAWTKSEPPQAWYLQGDQYGYFYYGREIAEGRGYVSYLTHEATAYYPVGYPALLAVLYFVALHTPVTDDLMLVTGLFHVAIGVATIYLTFVVGRRLVGAKTGLVAAGLMAVWPNLVYQVSAIQLELAFIFFTMAALAVIVDHDWRRGVPSRNRLLAFGALLSVSAMIRPFSVFVLVGLGVAALVVTGGLRAGWKPSLRSVAWPVLVLVVVFLPWTIRNLVQLDTFAPSSTNMGDGLCLDRSMDALGGFRWASHEGCVDPSLDEVERNRGNTELAIEFVRKHPGRELLQIYRRAGFMFADDHDGLDAVHGLGPEPRFSSHEYERLRDLANAFYFTVLWLSVPGLVIAAIRARRPERWLAGSLFVGLLAVPLLLYGNPRFHVPLAPFGALGAAASITALVGALAGLGRRGQEERPAPARPATAE